jgi:hypothetical protein
VLVATTQQEVRIVNVCYLKVVNPMVKLYKDQPVETNQAKVH